VSAIIVDGSGTAIDGDIVQACGVNLCQSGITDASGSVDLNVNLSLLKPMLLFGNALTYVKLAAPITTASMSFSTLTDPALPVTGVAFAPGSAITSGPVTLTLAADTQVAVDMLNYSTADEQEFRAVQVPTSSHQEDAIPGIAANNLILVFGVAPLETTFCPSAMVTVPNSASWPSGSAVQFLVFDVDTAQLWAPYGDWHQVAQGQVSADGSTISTAPGDGFPVLETFGIRLAL
jgi:hypothetical protein